MEEERKRCGAAHRMRVQCTTGRSSGWYDALACSCRSSLP